MSILWKKRFLEGEKETPYENETKTDIDFNSDMEKIRVKELQERVEHLETEVELLKELIKLQNKCPERVVPTYPLTPLQPYFSKEPTLEPPYKFTCGNIEF